MLVMFLQDEFDNLSGLELTGKVHVEIINSASVSEIPVLVGNTTHLQLSLVKGRATVQVTQLYCIMLEGSVILF